MTKFKSIALIALAGVFLQSCSNDDDGPNNDPENGNYSKGVFILNEGGFNSANAEITYFDPTKDVSTTNPIQEIFNTAKDFLENYFRLSLKHQPKDLTKSIRSIFRFHLIFVAIANQNSLQ